MTVVISRDDNPVAEPALRILAWNTVDLNFLGSGAVALDCFNAFYETFESTIQIMKVAQKGHRASKPSQAAFQSVRDWFLSQDKGKFSGVFANGPDSKVLNVPSLPFFAAANTARGSYIEIAMPPDFDIAKPVIDAVFDALPGPNSVCAMVGMGFFVPQAKESLFPYLPRGFRRFRSALEIRAAQAIDCMVPYPEGSPFLRGHPNYVPGLPDCCGWRTLIGERFASELPDERPNLPELVFEEKQNCTLVTIGDRPIWGDLNLGEDVSGYAAVSEWLSGIRTQALVGATVLFNHRKGDLNGLTRCEDYFNRFDAL